MMSSRLRASIYSIAALVAFIGVVEAGYLTVLFLTGETAVCGGSAGCYEVLGSKYAHIGPVPVSGLGLIAYFSAFSFAIFAAFGYGRARLFFAITVLSMFLFTLGLLYLQAFVIHAFCRYCLFSAALIFFLAGMVVIAPPPTSNS